MNKVSENPSKNRIKNQMNNHTALMIVTALFVTSYLVSNVMAVKVISLFGLFYFDAGTIATAIGEDPGTLEEVYEPFLIKEGFLKRTPRGREVTELAYKHLGKSVYQNIRGLFD